MKSVFVFKIFNHLGYCIGVGFPFQFASPEVMSIFYGNTQLKPLQLNLSQFSTMATFGTEESGRCRDVSVMGR